MIRVPGVLLLVSWGNCWNGQGERCHEIAPPWSDVIGGAIGVSGAALCW